MKKRRPASQESLYYRSPPQNIDAEAALLSAVLVDNQVLNEIVDSVSAPDFYKSAHRVVYNGMIELSKNDEPIDLVTLAEWLRKKKKLQKAGGGAYLSKLIEQVPAAVNAVHYADIVREKAVLRFLIEHANAIVKRCQDETGNSREVIDYVERSLLEIIRRDTRSSLIKVADLIDGSIDVLEKRQANPGRSTGIESGFGELDTLTSGFQASDLIILAARPSVGKTALVLNFASHAAVRNGYTVGIFSLEMSKEQLVMRLLCAESRVSSNQLKTGFISVESWEHITSAADRLARSPIFIDDSPDNTIMSIRAKARRLKMEHGLDLLIVDYLQLMRLPEKSDRRDLEIAEISKSLKALARELDIPVMALSQLNRQLEMRDDKRPRLADLRESGALEQDADLVLLIHREAVFQKARTAASDDSAELIIAKQRNGPTGSLFLTFLDHISRFENYASVR